MWCTTSPNLSGRPRALVARYTCSWTRVFFAFGNRGISLSGTGTVQYFPWSRLPARRFQWESPLRLPRHAIEQNRRFSYAFWVGTENSFLHCSQTARRSGFVRSIFSTPILRRRQYTAELLTPNDLAIDGAPSPPLYRSTIVATDSGPSFWYVATLASHQGGGAPPPATDTGPGPVDRESAALRGHADFGRRRPPRGRCRGGRG